MLALFHTPFSSPSWNSYWRLPLCSSRVLSCAHRMLPPLQWPQPISCACHHSRNAHCSAGVHMVRQRRGPCVPACATWRRLLSCRPPTCFTTGTKMCLNDICKTCSWLPHQKGKSSLGHFPLPVTLKLTAPHLPMGEFSCGFSASHKEATYHLHLVSSSSFFLALLAGDFVGKLCTSCFTFFSFFFFCQKFKIALSSWDFYAKGLHLHS